MPSELQRVAQELLNALDEIPRVVSYLHDRASKYREAAAWVGGLSSNPNARMAAMQLDEAAGRCEEAAHYLSMAPPRARGWVEQMVSGVRTAEPAADSTARRPDGAGGSAQPAEGRRGDEQAEPEAKRSGKPADAGDEARPEDGPVGRDREQFRPRASEILNRLPVRGRRDKTRGAWVDADGQEHDLISGVDEYSTDADRFMNENNIQIAPGDITLGSHVEVKFAMFMRERGLTDEIITINNWPCPGPYGCDENLLRFLPEGARLTVFGPAGFKRTYPRQDEDT